MQLSEIEFGNARPIEGYGPDFYRLNGQTHLAPVLIYGGEVHPWGGYEDVATLLALAGRVDVLLVGTGPQIAHLPKALRAELDAAGVPAEVMDSPAACRTYNVLLSEQRRVAVALLAAV
ncbi:MAG: hypothetical protein HLUCCA05_04440 [Roseibaca calidilacus]|uniref:Uncharacterized conserved protein, contains Mth938-like domain n=1 Tax=Roseibaca calidilacus TaxID=1666912 RepID=A0A0P7X5X7_9RHOB|nr:Mth938-like domain-containing protein [Roseibaca calidilacus]KPP95928.1 MAG: hypothetical protein HLUCCA05_04440 [Roseibaca calidilacus]CUX81477.1 Uncharacterized conserved protein, contains Mth938-like domain [Roseibaca calidilacus]